MEARKALRLKGYDYSLPGYYFITVCTYQRQALFETCAGAQPCVPSHESVNSPIRRWLYELERKYPGVEIDTYCVMPDHIHAIVVLTGAHTGAPLPEIVKWYKTQTTNAYIGMVRRGECLPFKRHLWQRGYYEHVIRNDLELMETREYILGNLMKA